MTGALLTRFGLLVRAPLNAVVNDSSVQAGFSRTGWQSKHLSNNVTVRSTRPNLSIGRLCDRLHNQQENAVSVFAEYALARRNQPWSCNPYSRL